MLIGVAFSVFATPPIVFFGGGGCRAFLIMYVEHPQKRQKKRASVPLPWRVCTSSINLHMTLRQIISCIHYRCRLLVEIHMKYKCLSLVSEHASCRSTMCARSERDRTLSIADLCPGRWSSRGLTRTRYGELCCNDFFRLNLSLYAVNSGGPPLVPAQDFTMHTLFLE